MNPPYALSIKKNDYFSKAMFKFKCNPGGYIAAPPYSTSTTTYRLIIKTEKKVNELTKKEHGEIISYIQYTCPKRERIPWGDVGWKKW